MKYGIASFYGRCTGAIGCAHYITAKTSGVTTEDLTLNLYDRYEHITGLSIQEVSKEEHDTFKDLYTPVINATDALESLMRNQ